MTVIDAASQRELQRHPMQRQHRLDRNDQGNRTEAKGMRVALYSHDTMGLGHLRRNLLIAGALANCTLKTTNLLITGAVETNFFRLPSRTDCLTLPRWRKSFQGAYSSGLLDVSGSELAELRAGSIRSALEVFSPDLFIIDKAPSGTGHELVPALEMLTQKGHTKIVLGLRDVLDSPEVVSREWFDSDNLSAIERFFDAVWVYGDPRLYDAVAEYSLPSSISEKVTYTGYLDQSTRVAGDHAETRKLLDSIGPHESVAACLVGGGQDGTALARTFIDALPEGGMTGVLVTGPFMPAADRQTVLALSIRRENLHVLDFLPEADLLIERADRVISMAGYNTVCSLLSFRKHALLIPRTEPRCEQLLRAQKLSERGLIDMLLPNQVDAQSLRNWLLKHPSKHPTASDLLSFDGLGSVCRLANELAGTAIANGSDQKKLVRTRTARTS